MTTGEQKPRNPCRYCAGGLGARDGAIYIDHEATCPARQWNAALEQASMHAMMESLAHPDRLWWEQSSYQEAVTRLQHAIAAYDQQREKGARG